MKAFVESEDTQENIKATKEDKNYIIRLQVSWESVDRDWEIIKQNGIDWSHFDKNPVILLDHTYKVSHIAWKSLKRETIWTDTFLTVQLAKWVPAWELARKLHEQWMLKWVSIWFIAKERNWSTITKSEALEASLVTMGSYRDALIEDVPLQKSCKEAWLLEVAEKALAASSFNAWDNVAYRTVYKTNDDSWNEVERIFPRENELPMMWKIIAKYTSWTLLSWDELITPSEENPFLMIQAYVKSKSGPILLRTYSTWYEFEQLRIENVIEEKSIEEGDVKFASQEAENQNLDTKLVLHTIKEIWDEVKNFKSDLKSFANDNAKIEKIERARKAGQNLASLLGDALKELK